MGFLFGRGGGMGVEVGVDVARVGVGRSEEWKRGRENG